MKFCHSSDLRLWRTGMLLFTKTKGHMSNVHYSGFPKHLQTKSNLHISISQSKLKHKCLPLDTLYVKMNLKINYSQRMGAFLSVCSNPAGRNFTTNLTLHKQRRYALSTSLHRGATAGKAPKVPKAWALPRFWVSIWSYKKQPVKKNWGWILGLVWLKFTMASLLHEGLSF